MSAALAVADIPAAVAEVERAAGLGFRCINLPAQQPHLPYNRPDYDPLWAALQDSGMVANFHIGTGHVPQGERGPGGPTINYVIFAQGDGPHLVSYLCASGVLRTLPETAVGGRRVGRSLAGLGAREPRPDLPEAPHVPTPDGQARAAAERVLQAAGTCVLHGRRRRRPQPQFTGCQTLMFGTDYPHHEGTFPHTQEVIDRIFAGVPDHETAMIVGGNAAKLYGFTLD